MSNKVEDWKNWASLAEVEKGIDSMRAAWNKGIKFTITDSNGKEKPDSAAIKKACKGDANKAASEAEKLRKYRAMSTRIKEEELNQIFNWCRESNRAWGPTLLCELSSIPGTTARMRIAKHAIKHRMGLVDLKRMVRLKKGSPNSTRSKTARVGRKRTLDWTKPANVLDEIRQVCGIFLSLVRDIQSVMGNEEAETVKVRESLKTTVAKVDTASKKVKLLYRHCNNKLKKYPKG